jgi:hypothetical protein
MNRALIILMTLTSFQAAMAGKLECRFIEPIAYDIASPINEDGNLGLTHRSSNGIKFKASLTNLPSPYSGSLLKIDLSDEKNGLTKTQTTLIQSGETKGLEIINFISSSKINYRVGCEATAQ